MIQWLFSGTDEYISSFQLGSKLWHPGCRMQSWHPATTAPPRDEIPCLGQSWLFLAVVLLSLTVSQPRAPPGRGWRPWRGSCPVWWLLSSPGWTDSTPPGWNGNVLRSRHGHGCILSLYILTRNTYLSLWYFFTKIQNFLITATKMAKLGLQLGKFC